MGSGLAFGAINTAAFLFCTTFIAYVALILIPFLRHKAAPAGDRGAFQWHLIVPCLDEGAVIADTVTTLCSSFPGVHLWCIDDGSTDATPLVLARLARRHRQVHVVTRRAPDARRGKGAALNAGWAAICAWLPADADRSAIVVGVVDADARLAPDSLDVIAGEDLFGDDKVGAVQIQVRVSNRLNETDDERRMRTLLVRLQDLEFSGPIAAMQLLRQRTTSVGMGGNGQFTRLSVLDEIAARAGTPWHGALLEDFELGLHVILAGHRNEYCHDTWVDQDGLRQARPLIRQRSRWAQGSMQCFRYLMPVLKSPNVTTSGAVEISYFLLLPWLQLLGAIIYGIATGVTAWYALSNPQGLGQWLSGGAWGALPLVVIFGIGPFFIWGPIYRRRCAPEWNIWQGLGLGLANWLYSYLHYASVWWAFCRVVRARHDWKKTARASDVAGDLGDLTLLGRFTPRRSGRHVVTATLRCRPAEVLEANGGPVVSIIHSSTDNQSAPGCTASSSTTQEVPCAS